MKTKFALGSLDTFYQYLIPGSPKVTALAAKVLCMFGTTYLCEQVFSVMNITKTKLCSWPTHAYLNDILKVAATLDLTPNIDTLSHAYEAEVGEGGCLPVLKNFREKSLFRASASC